MLRFLLFLAVLVGVAVLIKPDLIDIAKEEMQMRERTNDLIEQSPPISLNEAIATLKENYPVVENWTFTGIVESAGSLIYSVSDKNVFNIAKFKASHDMNDWLKQNKAKAIAALCKDDTILNLLAHETTRYVYVQYYDKQGIDYGRSLIDNGDCGLWPFSFERVMDKVF